MHYIVVFVSSSDMLCITMFVFPGSEMLRNPMFFCFRFRNAMHYNVVVLPRLAWMVFHFEPGGTKSCIGRRR